VLIPSTLITNGLEGLQEKVKERIDTYKKDIKKTMPLSDQLNMRDP
jgi:hypothetical protein